MTHPNSPDALPLICEDCHSTRCDCRPCVNPHCTEFVTPHRESGLCCENGFACADYATDEARRRGLGDVLEITRDGLLVTGSGVYRPVWIVGGEVSAFEAVEVLAHAE